jgi:LytS/YehU family sensor histidine kinase
LIRLYLELEALRFEQPLHYAIDVDSEVDTHNWQVPSLIFQPLVENAIWHGLVHQTGPRKLQIVIRLDGPNRLLSVIDDNGVGRKKASESRKTVYGTSQGLKLVAERITLLEKSGWGQGSLQIDDLTDATGEPGGTRVSVWLPIITELSLRTKFTHTTTHVQSTGH